MPPHLTDRKSAGAGSATSSYGSTQAVETTSSDLRTVFMGLPYEVLPCEGLAMSLSPMV